MQTAEVEVKNASTKGVITPDFDAIGNINNIVPTIITMKNPSANV